MKFVFVTKYRERFEKANTRVKKMTAMHASNHRTHALCTDLHSRVQKMVAIHASDNGVTLCTELHINMKEIL